MSFRDDRVNLVIFEAVLDVLKDFPVVLVVLKVILKGPGHH